MRSDASSAGASLGPSELLDALLLDATRSLFESQGLELELEASSLQPTIESASFVAVIGFSSSTLNGSLLLALPRAVIERKPPAAEVEPMDWCGDLAHQLLGRLKSQLIGHGLSIDSTLPVVISGGHLALHGKTRPITRQFSFASAGGTLSVRLEAELTPDAQLVPPDPLEAHRPLEEGELLQL